MGMVPTLHRQRVAMSNRRRAGRSAATAPTREPRTLVTVLSTREQLADAAQRAALFERLVAARATARAAEYDALLEDAAPAAATAGSRELSKGTDDDERRSA